MENINRLTADKLNSDGRINLLEAFVEYLSDDFKCAFREYRSHPHDKDCVEHYNTLRDIFKSDHFSLMTGLDGESIVDSLEYACCKPY